MSIRTASFLNQPAYEMENEYLKAIILPEEGCNMISLVDKRTDTEILRTPKTIDEYQARRMVFGTPVLFPPNRIENGVFTFEGKTYHMDLNRVRPNENNHIHGFVHDKKWSFKHSSENEEKDELIFSLWSTDYESILKQYPQVFVFTMKFVLSGDSIEQILSVKNFDKVNIPLGIGYHTTFNFTDDSKFQIEIGKQWELAPNSVPTGNFLEYPLQKALSEGTTLGDTVLDDVFQMKENKTAVITHLDKGVKVSYTADESFHQWVLFTADGKSAYLAIEPYSWVTNAPNLSLPAEITGMYSLKPGETKEFKTLIRVESY